MQTSQRHKKESQHTNNKRYLALEGIGRIKSDRTVMYANMEIIQQEKLNREWGRRDKKENFIFIHIYVYIYIYICMYTYVCIYMCIYICMYTYTYVYMHKTNIEDKQKYTCIFICLFIERKRGIVHYELIWSIDSIHVYFCLSSLFVICIYIHVNIHICIHIHTYISSVQKHGEK
jgi:hypothetical protein